VAEQDRPAVAAERERWRAQVIPRLDPDRVAVINETWATTNMARTHGYAPRGRRRADAARFGHGHKITGDKASAEPAGPGWRVAVD
jgi:hypothetical protein